MSWHTVQGGVATEAGIRNLGLRTGEESYLHYLPRHSAEATEPLLQVLQLLQRYR